MAEVRLSEMPILDEFPSSGKVYGIASGRPAAAYTRNAFIDLINRSEAGLNKFTTQVNANRVGNVITYPAGIAWLLQGVAKTNTVNNVVTIPFAETGKSRIDLIVATANNQFVRVPGIEVSEPNAPASPPLPVATLLASTILVEDASVGFASDPSIPVYVGEASSIESFLGAVPRSYLGYFGFVRSSTQFILMTYASTGWVPLQLNPYNELFIWLTGSSRVFQVPEGVTVKNVFVNEVLQYNSPKTGHEAYRSWSQNGRNVTITDDVLFDDESRVLITN